jgi:tol-pal system protein YbgF
MKKPLILLASLVFFGGCANQVALVSKDKWEKQKAGIERIRFEIRKLEAQIADLRDAQSRDLKLLRADLNVLFADLNRNMSRVSGQLEENEYKLKDLRKTAKKLSERKYLIKGRAKGDSAAAGGDSVIVQDRLDVQKLFKIARQDFNARDYNRARKEFDEIQARYPKDDVADDCLYWSGECFYVQKKYKKATAAYQKVLRLYPKGNILPSAMFKLGLSFQKLGSKAKAKKTWENLVRKYPHSDEALLAKARLAK